MRTTRRQFHRRALGAAASLGVGGSLSAALSGCELFEGGGGEPLPIVDTHQHLWDLTKFQPPWLDAAPEVLRRSYVTRDYIAATRELNVVKAVYMEVDVSPAQQVDEAEHIIALSRSADHPTVAAVISGRPAAADEFRRYMQRFADSPYIKGVRQVLQVPDAPRGLCLEDAYVESVRLLGTLGKSFDLCMRPRELADGVELARRCPETQFILDHCGNGDPKAFLPSNTATEEPWHDADEWRRDIEAFAALENVVCKISGIVARAPEGWGPEHLAPIVDVCLDAFGPDRVVFGSDWPVCNITASLGRWVEALHAVIARRSVDDRRKLLHDNAVRLYGLTGA